MTVLHGIMIGIAGTLVCVLLGGLTITVVWLLHVNSSLKDELEELASGITQPAADAVLND